MVLFPLYSNLYANPIIFANPSFLILKLLFNDVAYLILNNSNFSLYSEDKPCSLPFSSSKPIPDSIPFFIIC